MINKYTDPIITNYRFDSSGSKITVPITESLKITNGIIFLKEIPDKRNGTTISSFSEVQKPEDLDSENKFYVDYNTGVVYFDTKKNGTQVNITYHGIGIVYYPASRIYLEVDENHDIVKTLSDIEGQISSLSGLRNEQRRLKQEIEDRNSELNKSIEEAKTINLDGSVEKAKQAKTDLEGTTRKANIADANLRTDIEFAKGVKIDLKKQEDQSKAEIQKSVNLANTTKTSLDGSITTANEKINKASEKVNEISSKISEANETQQKLTNTKNDITTSLSDYDKKSAEIKLSTGEIESKSNELKSTIASADESNTTLNSTIEKSKESNTTLSNTVKESKTKNTELSSSITTATNLKGQLDTKNKETNDNITSLDSKISEGTQLKSKLGTLTTNANQANTELKITTQTADKTKTSLEQLKNESSSLSNELSEGNTTAGSNIESLKSENQNAKTNITGLQTENQNALSKQETLSSETEKANEAISKIAELIASSTDLKNKLEQIVASGDLDKYVTDPKLREILTAYATKDDLSKIDVTSQLIDYAKKTDLDIKIDKSSITDSYEEKSKDKILSQIGAYDLYLQLNGEIENATKTKAEKDSIPTSLSQLTDDETHRLVTDTEKEKWNNPPNPDLTDYTKKEDFENFKSSVPNNIIQAINFDRLNRCIVKDFNDGTGTFNIGAMWFERMLINDTESNVILLTHFIGDTTFVEQIAFDIFNVKIFMRHSVKIKNFDREKATVVCEWDGWRSPGYQNANMEDIEIKADKFDLPSALSQLTNDTNFKTEAEIQEMIANSSKLKKEVTTSLPSTGKDDVIYLLKDMNGKDNNNYLEYLWIDSKWELIGSTQVDLSGYAQKSEVESKAEKADIPTKVSQLENDEDYIKIKDLTLQAMNGGWRNSIGDFNKIKFKQGLEFIVAIKKEGMRRYAVNFPNGLGKYFVYTNFGLNLKGEIQIEGTVNQLIFCLENRKFYIRSGVTTSDVTNGVSCKWGELQEIKSPTPNLSPFTQQELEEAFK